MTSGRWRPSRPVRRPPEGNEAERRDRQACAQLPVFVSNTCPRNVECCEGRAVDAREIRVETRRIHGAHAQQTAGAPARRRVIALGADAGRRRVRRRDRARDRRADGEPRVLRLDRHAKGLQIRAGYDVKGPTWWALTSSASPSRSIVNVPVHVPATNDCEDDGVVGAAVPPPHAVARPTTVISDQSRHRRVHATAPSVGERAIQQPRTPTRTDPSLRRSREWP